MRNPSTTRWTQFGQISVMVMALCGSFMTQALAAAEQTAADVAATKPFAIAIHGGAGTIDRARFTPELEAEYRAKLREATDAGYQVLASGGKAEQAVTAAIVVLENSPFFNAGHGAVYTYDGVHELDASIMLGRDRKAGAVAGVQHIANPILLAQAVMLRSEHVLLTGSGAEQFAKNQGFALVDNQVFDTKDRLDALQKAKQMLDKPIAQQALLAHQFDYKFGTVGAVALDSHGDLAAGTSTGGMTAKRYGRVGDSPIIGAGTFADNQSCAVSATGHGEYFIRYNVAADICARVKYQGISAKHAAEQVVNSVLVEAGGAGGVIVIDRLGQVSMPFNTKGMYRAMRSSNGVQQVAIFADE